MYEDNEKLIAEYQEGNSDLLGVIVENNQSLVHHVLKGFKWAYNRHPKYDEIISYDDLFQEGMIGLCDAAKDYDPELGAFSTYATIHIKKSIYKFYYNNASVIRVPPIPRGEYKQLKQAENDYIAKYGEEPSTKQLSRYSKMSIDKILDLRRIFSSTMSFDSPIKNSEDGAISVGDSIADDTDYLSEVERRLSLESLRKDLKSMADVSIKDKRKIKILFTYFDELENKLVQDIAKDLNISRSNMSRIVNESVGKMSRMFMDVLVKEYADLITTNIRKSKMDNLKYSKTTAQIMVSKLIQVGDHITVNRTYSENDELKPMPCTVEEIRDNGVLVKYISYHDKKNNYLESHSVIHYSNIVDYRTVNRRIVEIGCLRGLS